MEHKREKLKVVQEEIAVNVLGCCEIVRPERERQRIVVR